MGDVDCAGCGSSIDTLEETHYRVGEDERPVDLSDEPEFDDFFSRGWFLCRDCFTEVVDDGS